MKFVRKQKTREVESLNDLVSIIQEEKNLDRVAFQNLDLLSVEDQLKEVGFSRCIFLGCKLSEGREYQKWLGIYDDMEDVLNHIYRFTS